MIRLLIDTPFLCHRAFHSTGNMTHDKQETGVIFGLLRDIRNLTALFKPDQIVFAWDRGVPKRKELHPSYKISRELMTIEQRDQRKKLHGQMTLLEREILPALGYNNVFGVDGYEADDIIGSVVRAFADTLDRSSKTIIVGVDSDLFQLINRGTSLWNPNRKKLYDEHVFQQEYGIHPSKWLRVKCLAGDTTDNVPGVPRVGIKTAIKYLRGDLVHGHKTYRNIKQAEQDGLDKKNRRLIRLPFENCPEFRLVPDNTSIGKWEQVLDQYGITSLREFDKVGV